jgi:hypothetical protein
MVYSTLSELLNWLWTVTRRSRWRVNAGLDEAILSGLQKGDLRSGANSSEYATPDGARVAFGLWFYKEAAPKALRSAID